MHQVDTAEFIQLLIEDVEALRMAGLPIYVRPQSRQTHSQLDRRLSERIDKALGDHCIMPMNVVPVGLDHQERGIGILKEPVEVSGASIKAPKKWLCSHLGQCVESWTTPRQGLYLMPRPQQVLCELRTDSSGCAYNSNSHDSLSPVAWTR